MLRRLSEGQKRNVAHWAMEFVVVVAGVLLALWLQEIANEAGRRADAQKAEAAIRDELDDNLILLITSEATADCRKNRLIQIDEKLRTGNTVVPIDSHEVLVLNQKARISPFQQRAVWGSWPIDASDTAWRGALANGSLAGMDPGRFRGIADLYARYAQVQKLVERDRESSERLQVLAYGTTLTPELRASLIAAHTAATRSWISLDDAGDPRAMAREMKRLGWNDRARLDERIGRLKSELATLRQTFKPCAKAFRNPFDGLD